MSQSSYSKASDKHRAQESIDGSPELSGGVGEDESEDVLVPAEEYPIRGVDDELPLEGGEPDDGAVADSHAEEFVGEVPETTRFFANGQKKKPHVAKSFTDQFIDSRDPVNDEEYFIKYQGGDDKAFFVIYERYRGSVYAYCARVLLSAGLTEELVEDTFQEIFLRVSQYRNSFRHGEFRAWLFTVTRNTCLSSKKRGLRNLHSTNGSVDPDLVSEEEALERGSHINRGDDPLELLSAKEQSNLLQQAIAELPETYREALMLSEFEGLTYEEIGKLTGTSLSTIRIRVFRAKKRLRKVLYPILGTEYAAGGHAPTAKEDEDENE